VARPGWAAARDDDAVTGVLLALASHHGRSHTSGQHGMVAVLVAYDLLAADVAAPFKQFLLRLVAVIRRAISRYIGGHNSHSHGSTDMGWEELLL
jgi:hypothetical protein